MYGASKLLAGKCTEALCHTEVHVVQPLSSDWKQRQTYTTRMPVEMRIPTGRLLSLDFIIRSDPRRVIPAMTEFVLFFFPPRDHLYAYLV
jgi:hypothetical protein